VWKFLQANAHFAGTIWCSLPFYLVFFSTTPLPWLSSFPPRTLRREATVAKNSNNQTPLEIAAKNYTPRLALLADKRETPLGASRGINDDPFLGIWGCDLFCNGRPPRGRGSCLQRSDGSPRLLFDDDDDGVFLFFSRDWKEGKLRVELASLTSFSSIGFWHAYTLMAIFCRVLEAVTWPVSVGSMPRKPRRTGAAMQVKDVLVWLAPSAIGSSSSWHPSLFPVTSPSGLRSDLLFLTFTPHLEEWSVQQKKNR